MRLNYRFVSLTLALCLASGVDRMVTGQAALTAQSGHEGAAAAVSPRVSILEGAANFRDIGGYATADGRHVRKGVVYRSNQLSDLTANDFERLNALGIKLVCDFRTDGERRRSPTQWQGATSPEMMRAQIMKEADVNMSAERLRELTTRSSATLATAYDSMVAADPAAEYGHLYKQIAAGKLPVIAHCTAGKDRTGVFSAVLLTMLGVPRSSVIDDYMLTGEYMTTAPALAQAARDMQKTFGTAERPSEATMRAIYEMHAEVLTNTFATIDRLYGSFDGFVRDGLKLTASDVAGLRTQLLE
jgi:protein-tyrosine phosphatase